MMMIVLFSRSMRAKLITESDKGSITGLAHAMYAARLLAKAMVPSLKQPAVKWLTFDR